MPDLTRSQFCELTCLSADVLKSLTRRGQIPFAVDQKASGRGYTVFEAFLTIMAQDFVEQHGVNLTRAAEIAAALPNALAPDWSRIVAGAEGLFERGGPAVDPIMCGRCRSAGLDAPEPICGTHAEIVAKLDRAPKVNIMLTLSSATHGLGTLLRRAVDNGIEIPEDFWLTPFTYRERLNSAALMVASMKKLIADGAHLQDVDE